MDNCDRTSANLHVGGHWRVARCWVVSSHEERDRWRVWELTNVSARESSRVFPRLRLSRLSAAELQYTCTQGERGAGGSSREECERRWDGGRVGARVRRSRRSCGRARERTRRRRRRRTGSWTPARGLQIPTPGHILDTLWTPYTCIVDFGPRLSTPGSWTPARGRGLTGVSGVLDEFGTHPGLLDLLPTAVRPHSSRQTHHWTPDIDPGTHHILDSSCTRTCLGFQRNHGLLAEPSWIPGCVLEFETQLGGYTPYRELLDQSLTPGSWTPGRRRGRTCGRLGTPVCVLTWRHTLDTLWTPVVNSL